MLLCLLAGIQAIKAVLAGARKVDAVDIYEVAVECAKHNVVQNGLGKRIKVWRSDLFSNIPKVKYDLIIANLPILDYPEQDIRFHSLSDPGFSFHKGLFRSASEYLTDNGKIRLCHADLQGKQEFSKLEGLAKRNGFSYNVVNSVNSLGYEWRKYEFEVGG